MTPSVPRHGPRPAGPARAVAVRVRRSGARVERKPARRVAEARACGVRPRSTRTEHFRSWAARGADASRRALPRGGGGRLRRRPRCGRRASGRGRAGRCPRLVEVLRDAAEEERPAGAEDQAGVDVGRRRRRRPRRAGAGPRRRPPRAPRRGSPRRSRRCPATTISSSPSASSRASARAGSGPARRRASSRARGWRPRGPTICSSTDGAIGMPSDSIASSVSSTVLPFSSASISTVVMRVSTRLTTKPGASPTSTPRLRSFLTTSHAVASCSSSSAACGRSRRAASPRPG